MSLGAFCMALSMMVSSSSAPKAPPLAVMIHGAGGGGWEWKFWQEEFEKAGWRVAAPDLMPAEAGLAATRFEDYLAQVESWSEGASEVVLIGASLGGILALKAAERLEPGAVVFVNGVPPKRIPRKVTGQPIPEIIRWANGPLQDTIDAMPDSDEATIRWAHPQWRDESGAVVREVREGIEVGALKNLPMLVVIGERDTDILPASNRAVAARYGADIHAYAGMSHVGPLLSTRAREVARQTLGWLAARGYSGASR